MIHLTSSLIFKGVERAIYLFILICLGVYFIYIGDVVNRFQAKKTNLAEYFEPITELPTIFAWIEFSEGSKPTNFKLGLDFNITWIWDYDDMDSYSLRLGKNIFNNGLELEFEEVPEIDIKHPLMYKIIPLNFPDGMPKDYLFSLHFDFTKNDTTVERAGIAFSTRNNSHCGGLYDGNFFDGKVFESLAKKRELKLIKLSPVKYLYTDTHEKCRNRPYHDLLLIKALQSAETNCNKPCRTEDFIVCNPEHRNITLCANHADGECFLDQKSAVAEGIPIKPCTKVEYEAHVRLEPKTDKNQTIQFWVQFSNPPKVRVKEEYLLFDMVTMISAIGGTMGLCIGFSFGDITKWMIGFIERCFNMVHSRILDRSGKESQHHLEMGLG